MSTEDYQQEAALNGADFSQDQNGDSQGAGDKINATRNTNDAAKIFVGGLSWETTLKDLKEYFEKFGEIDDATLKVDAGTGRSRGFGFVTFKNAEVVDTVLEQETHTLHKRTIDPKRAKARGGREPIKKVFVGGLDPELPEADIRTHFGAFGKIVELDLPFDKVQNKRRQFCFITFESEEDVDKVVANAKQTLGGKEVDVKKATPKSEQYNQSNRGYPQWGGQGYDYSGYGYGGYGAYGGGYGYGYDQYGAYGGYGYDQYYGQGQPAWGGYGGYGGNKRYSGGSGNYNNRKQ
jgi:RNA recognition motif-containing protein